MLPFKRNSLRQHQLSLKNNIDFLIVSLKKRLAQSPPTRSSEIGLTTNFKTKNMDPKLNKLFDHFLIDFGPLLVKIFVDFGTCLIYVCILCCYHGIHIRW